MEAAYFTSGTSQQVFHQTHHNCIFLHFYYAIEMYLCGNVCSHMELVNLYIIRSNYKYQQYQQHGGELAWKYLQGIQFMFAPGDFDLKYTFLQKSGQ